MISPGPGACSHSQDRQIELGGRPAPSARPTICALIQSGKNSGKKLEAFREGLREKLEDN
jgi:hypothetical protein